MNELEREILECLAKGWVEGDMRLPGHVCYQDVLDFLAKHGIEDPGIAKRLEESSRLCRVFDEDGWDGFMETMKDGDG